jgi:hypothetical protein
MRLTRIWLLAAALAALAPGPATAGGGEGGEGREPDPFTDPTWPYVPPGPNVWNIFYVRNLTPEELRRRARQWAEESPVDVLTLEQRMQWIADHGGWYPGASPIDALIALVIP